MGAHDNAFVVGPVSVPVPDVWGASAVPMGRSVTLAQFVRGLSSIAPTATKQERMRVCFGAFDLNGDGFIDPPEMQTGFTSLYTSMAESGGALHVRMPVSFACCLSTTKHCEITHADDAT